MVVGAAVHHRHQIVAQDVPKLFADVVDAQGVLERQVELVAPAEQPVARRIRLPVAGVATAAQVAALAVHVDVDVALQLLHVPLFRWTLSFQRLWRYVSFPFRRNKRRVTNLALRRRRTVRRHPGHGALLRRRPVGGARPPRRRHRRPDLLRNGP